jgi:hypothetical protein
LAAETSWDYLMERELKQQLQRLEPTVLKGDAEDFAAYKYLCGQIRGIQFALTVLIDLRADSHRDGDLE